MASRRQVLGGLGAITILGLVGCGRGQEQASACTPLPFVAGDECSVCGMYITEHSGPKGQVCLRGGRGIAKFCSTTDLFAWLLQPEARALADAVYVHDLGQTDWAQPHDTALIDGRAAWYVIGHPLLGAMGAALAPFAERAAAEDFAAQYDGELLALDQIDLEALNVMRAGGAPGAGGSVDWDALPPRGGADS